MTPHTPPGDSGPPPGAAGRAPTIAEYIADLGAPRNRAEETVIERMARLEVEHANIQAVRDAGGCSALTHMVLVEQQNGLWRAALELHLAVRAFRDTGGVPPGWAQQRSPSGDC